MKVISRLCWFAFGFLACFVLFMVREPTAAKRVGKEISEKASEGATLAGQGIESARVVIAKIKK